MLTALNSQSANLQHIRYTTFISHLHVGHPRSFKETAISNGPALAQDQMEFSGMVDHATTYLNHLATGVVQKKVQNL